MYILFLSGGAGTKEIINDRAGGVAGSYLSTTDWFISIVRIYHHRHRVLLYLSLTELHIYVYITVLYGAAISK